MITYLYLDRRLPQWQVFSSRIINTMMYQGQKADITLEESEEQLGLRIEQLKEYNAKLRAQIEYLQMVNQYLGKLKKDL